MNLINTTTLIAKKDLVCDLGVKCFTSGKEYDVHNFPLACSVSENMIIKANNQGEYHRIGNWYKHFKLKK